MATSAISVRPRSISIARTYRSHFAIAPENVRNTQYAPPGRGSQRDGFRERGTRHRFLQQLNRDDVYIITPEGLPRLLQEPRRAHQGVTVSRIHLDEDVDVAARVRITSGHRPEESWVRSVVLREPI